ncbi:MAG: DUF5916 domain-containing protein [Melioribacteraceae bacterium]
MLRCVLLILIIIFFSENTYSQKLPSSNEVIAHKTSELINLDGELLESVWKKNPTNYFIQREPQEGKPATQKSEVRVAFDNENLYVSGMFYDTNPDSIDNSLMRRDNMVPSDWFFLFLDPYNDNRTGYYFAVNPGGSISDGILFNDSWDDNSWDGVWESKTKITENGWIAEIKIPFSQLRFNENEKMVWGINFNRDIKRNGENSFYIMVPPSESGFVSKFADLIGLEGIEFKQRLEVLPYIVQKAQYLKHENGDPFYKGNQYQTSVGADFKIGIGSNFNIDATVNPDFGQVEVDPAVINLSAFETYFQEKRPFFIEGQNMFYFGIGGANNNWGFNFGNPELFYSRRIGRAPQGNLPDYEYVDYPKETRILGAAKLTGKIDENWSLGALNTVTERTFSTISINNKKSDWEVEPLTNYGVFRTQKQFDDNRHSIGAMFTSVNRDLSAPKLNSTLSKEAYTFGLDGWTFLDSAKQYVITSYFVGSYTSGSKEYMTFLQEQPYRYFQRPDATYMKLDSNRTSIGGYYGRVMLNKQDGNFYINTALGVVSPGFENSDLGFQWMADKINGHLVLGYRWFDPDNIFRRKWVYLAHFRDYDFEGNLLNNGIMLYSSLQFLNYYGIFIQGFYNTEEYTRVLTRGGPLAKNPSQHSLNINASTDSREKLILELETSYYGDKLGSKAYDLGLELEWKPITQLSFSFGPNYSINKDKRQWIGSFADINAINTFNNRYVFGELEQKTISANIRLNWTITPQMSLQLFLQPLISVGNYNNFKELAKSASLDYNNYSDLGAVKYNSENDEYSIDPDKSGPSEQFTFSNPNFNYKSIRGTIVFRWEVLPGSIFYLVWSQDRDDYNNPGDLQFRRDFNNLISAETNDIFLAKFSYWLDI